MLTPGSVIAFHDHDTGVFTDPAPGSDYSPGKIPQVPQESRNKEPSMTETIIKHRYQSVLVGCLELQVSDRGVRSISFISQGGPPEDSPHHPIMLRLIGELNEYFAGTRKEFSVPLDPDGGTGFQRSVWEELTRIPYGETRSYGDIASSVGNPRAARAVGLANKSNTIPILIPCHRVIRGNGGLGGYGSGIHVKRKLLALEGIVL